MLVRTVYVMLKTLSFLKGFALEGSQSGTGDQSRMKSPIG